MDLYSYEPLLVGASDDLDKVTKMAYRQVVEFGMSPRIGHISLPLRGSEPLSKSIYSQKLTKMIDEVCSIKGYVWLRDA